LEFYLSQAFATKSSQNHKEVFAQLDKNDHFKKEKRGRNFIYVSAGCSLRRAGGFSCNFEALHGGLRIK
jgi:hypothetical protein